jgi:hypothetical protein
MRNSLSNAVQFRRSVFLTAAVAVAFAAGCTPQTHGVKRAGFPSLVLPHDTVGPVVAEVPAPPPETGCPRILVRSDWGAARTLPNHDPMGKVSRITIHHSAMGVEEEAPIEEVKAKLRLIQASHTGYKGWADIGYHFIIDCSGRVWEGRPLEYQGAHAGNNEMNRGNIGICVMGNYDLQKPAAQQIDSLERLVAHLMKEYRIPLRRIYTHKEMNDLYGRGFTDCPGTNLQREVTAMRRRFAAASDREN